MSDEKQVSDYCVCGGTPDNPNRDCERCQLVAQLTALKARCGELEAAIQALKDADRYDHWSTRLSDSECAALNKMFRLTTKE